MDGFRFDLAATMGREEADFNKNASFFKAIQTDDVLSKVKLIAEPGMWAGVVTRWATFRVSGRS